MAINIQNIIDQITTRAAAADSSMSTDYLLTLSKAVLAMNQSSGVIEYKQKEYLPDVDSSHLGSFAFIRSGIDLDSPYADSYGAFFYAARVGSRDSAWDRIRTGSDGYTFQGSVSGYTSGGLIGAVRQNVIDKYPFSSDANATDVGDLTEVRQSAAGQSSSTHGYTSMGYSSDNSVTIDKFPFSVDANATDVGDMPVALHWVTGQSSETHGYTSAGWPPTRNEIQKFPFSVDENGTDVGDLTVARYDPAGQSSTINGYTSGGFPSQNVIDKFSFATDGNATDVGDLTTTTGGGSGTSSSNSGYTAGSATGAPILTNIIDKFPFATDANATDVGDLTSVIRGAAGQSSTTYGYRSGGEPQTAPTIDGSDVIDKFSFNTDGNATDVGDLTLTRRGPAGQQV